MVQETRTVLFTDVEGSTAVRTSQGDDAGDAIVWRHDRAVRACVERHGGTFVKGTGDGCLTVFPSARAAVVAAVEIQRDAIHPVRIGINSGEVRAADGDVFGEAVNAAARIAAIAGGGDILVSRVVRDLVGTVPRMTFATRGEVVLKGFPERWEVFAVEWTASAVELLDIRLLGEATVMCGGQQLPAFAAPRLQQLLARLVLAAGAPQPRMKLAFELWPDSEERQARTNLRKLLHDLRAALPDASVHLDVDDHTVRWRTDGPAHVDVLAFTDAVGRRDLEAAADAYGGDLLPGCYDDWLLAERDRLQTTAADVLQELATIAATRGDDAATVAHARRLVQLDSLDERGWRLLIQAHGRRGERAEGLRVYHRCADVLRREVGVDPDPATEAAYEALRSGASNTQDAPRLTPPSSDLVGRETEWQAVTATWLQASAGQARVLIVTGEAGVGKSRLIEDLARQVAASGHAVARTRCYEAAGRFPWGPVTEWLRSDAVLPSLGRLEPVWLAELVHLLPELGGEHVDIPEVSAALDEAGRRRLFEAVVRGLLAPARPLLLVLDDLQWCDPDSIELLAYFVRRAPNDPILVATTARSAELDDNDALRAVLAGLAHGAVLDEVALDRLDAAATVELAERLVRGTLPQEAAERLWAETEGNALFIVEAVRAGITGDVAISPTVQALIRSRLCRLSTDARAIVDIAGTLGRAFTVEELAAASGRGEDDLIDALDELWRHQVLREHGEGYDFSHDKLREVAQYEISPARRRRLHRDAADGLATLHGPERRQISARLATHYEYAGLAERAVECYRDAARHAIDLFSLDDAIAALHRALALLERLPAGNERDRVEVAIRVALGAATAAREGYNSTSTRDSYERAYALCNRLGEAVDPAVLRGIGLADLVACRFHRSLAFGRTILEESGDDAIATTEGHYLIGVSAFWLGDLHRSDHHLRAAIESYRTEHAPDHVTRFGQDPKAVCLIRLALTTLWLGDRDRALAVLDEAKAHATALAHPTSLAYVLVYAAIVRAELGDLDGVESELATSASLLDRQELHYFVELGLLLKAWLDHARGEPHSRARLVAAADDWRRSVQTLHLTYALTLLARMHLAEADPEAGLAVVREALAWTVEHDQRYIEPELLQLEGELLALAGDGSGAEAALRRALAVAEAQDAGWLRDRATRALARHPAIT